jgi:outer membrane protein
MFQHTRLDLVSMQYFLSLFFILSVVCVQAQQQSLSLVNAVQRGLQNNFDAQIQTLEVEQAKLMNNWGQAGRLPTINLTGNSNNNYIYRQPTNPFAIPGKSINNTVPGQLDVSWILFNGFGVRLNKARLEQLENQTAGNARFIVENTAQTIILGYYNSLLEKQRLRVRERVMRYSKERYDFVRLRKELGGAITFDVLQEQNNYLTDSANVLRQELAYRTAVRNLNELLNEKLDTEYIFSDSLLFETEELDYEAMRQKLTASNASLRNQFIVQELQRIATQSSRSALYPALNLNFGANGSIDQQNALFRPTTGGTVVRSTNPVGYLNDDENQPVWGRTTLSEYLTNKGYSYGAYANISLRFTLFNGGQVRRAVENARIDEKIAQLGTDRLKLSLENDLLANYDLYQLRRQLVVIAQTKLRAAELNLSLANERYRNGALSAIDLRIVQENFQNAALENYAAIFDILSIRTELVRMTGGLLEEYQAN